MPLIDGASVAERFSNFSIYQTDYKKVGDHGIRADVLIPKSLQAGKKAPVIVQFHGGALVFGDSLFSDWFSIWILELAEKHNAIIACGNYRMLPESTGVELLSDIDDWWKWLHTEEVANTLSSLPTPVELDLDRVITTGESAGGLLSVYLALTFPDEIRSATAAYPMFNADGEVDLDKVPKASEADILKIQKLADSGVLVSGDMSDERGDLSDIWVAGPHLFKYYPRNADFDPIHRERLYQLQRLEYPDTKLPRGGLAILHGAQDPIVPPSLSERFVEVARERLHGRQGADKIVLSVQEGSHGFENLAGLEEPWLQEALQTAVSVWLE